MTGVPTERIVILNAWSYVPSLFWHFTVVQSPSFNCAARDITMPFAFWRAHMYCYGYPLPRMRVLQRGSAGVPELLVGM